MTTVANPGPFDLREAYREPDAEAATGCARDRVFSADSAAGPPPRISAVVATYQGERYLAEQLRSMFAQRVALDEIIVTDDCSSDRTLAIAEAVCAVSPVPMHILRGEKNIGIGRNFERGLRAAQGDIVFLADQDDVWRQDKVERMVTEFSKRPELLLLFTNANLVGDQGDSLHRTLFASLRIGGTERSRVRNGSAFDALLRRNVATGATIAMRRSAITRALPIPSGWLHDEWIAMIAAVSGQIDFLDEALTDYRQHDGNVIGSKRETLVSIVTKLRCCRRTFNHRLLRRTELQLERLLALEPPADQRQIVAVQAKAEHLRRRCQFPAARLARIPPVARELLNGGYHHYSSGLRSVVGDLLGEIRDETDCKGR